MSDVDIVVETRDLKVAIDLLDQYGISFTQMVNKVQTESNRLARASKATTEELTKAFSLAGQQQAIQNAKRQAQEEREIERQKTAWFKQAQDERIAALKERAREEERVNREREKLTAIYNPLLAAEQRYLQMQAEIDKSHRLGILSIEQKEKALEQLKKEYDSLNAGVYLAGSRFNQFGEMAGIAGTRASKFGMYAQQAGYQIGDFAVQIQSGTNAGVAFSQQAAQLAGLIPGLAGALTTFAAIGIGALWQNLSRAKEEAKKTVIQISELKDLESLFKSVGNTIEDSLVQAISNVRREYGNLVADFASNRLTKSLDSIQAQLRDSLKEATVFNPDNNTGFFGRAMRMGEINRLSNRGDTERISEMIAEVSTYNNMLETVKSQTEKLFDGSINSADELINKFVEVYNAVSIIPGTAEKITPALFEAAQSAGILNEVLQRISEQENNRRKGEEILAEMQAEIRLMEIIEQHGKDSLEVTLNQLDAEKEKQASLIRSLSLEEDIENQLLSTLDAMYENKTAAETWEDAIRNANNQLQFTIGLLNTISGGMFENAGINAARVVLEKGGTVAQARLAQQRASERARLEMLADNMSNPDRLSASLELSQFEKRIAFEDELAAAAEAERNSKKSSGSGGRKSGRKEKKTEAEKAIEELEKFKEQFELSIEQQKRLTGVYGEQRELVEKVIDIESRLGDSRTLLTEKEIEEYAKRELAIERALEKEEERNRIYSASVENMLMDVVSGTKDIEDAFRSMLSNIILEIYKQQVAEPVSKGVGGLISGFLDGFSLWSANGNAFGSGGVKFFAKGGVVDSPTAFGYSGGLGVMGEAGPEAIMPLKRNSQGRLGVEVSGSGSSNVTVVQNFNISANGDESVRNIIRTEAPMIAKQAKLEVMDAMSRKQRGF